MPVNRTEIPVIVQITSAACRAAGKRYGTTIAAVEDADAVVLPILLNRLEQHDLSGENLIRFSRRTARFEAERILSGTRCIKVIRYRGCPCPIDYAPIIVTAAVIPLPRRFARRKRLAFGKR